MNWLQMQRRCPSARFVSLGRLIGYQFGITRHSRLRNCGTANVFQSPGQEVWGVVYDVEESDLELLDGFEDGYRREILMVQDESEQALAALVYVAELETNVPSPNAEYKRLMIEGAKHWGIPQLYLAVLEALEVAHELAQQLDPPVPPAKLSSDPA
jgi:gamma-glutamylcyclotransferase